MKFDHLWALSLLTLLPLALLALIYESRKKRNSLAHFAESNLLVNLTGEERKGRNFFKNLLLIIALGLMIVAMSGPRWGSHYQEVNQKGVDIMIVVDVSPSMLVEDVKPSRLERAKREILDFINVVQGDRIGLVAFSGSAFIQCPLTLDYGACQMFLSDLKPGLIPVPGTDIGAAIDEAISSFDINAKTDRVILLITDGEDNEGKGLGAAEKAKAKGVKIFVFGIGDTSGGPIPSSDGAGGFQKDKKGKLILSKLDEESLKRIATTTGGDYVRAVAGDLDLDILYFDGIKYKTDAVTLKSGKIKVYEERFPIFLFAAFALLLMEAFIDVRRIPKL
ncbi:MAG: VWA domain-containing protein [Spirochaetota bacterium]|nr:VWA domain-containing protein [Spirochaetota bacterium]